MFRFLRLALNNIPIKYDESGLLQQLGALFPPLYLFEQIGAHYEPELSLRLSGS